MAKLAATGEVAEVLPGGQVKPLKNGGGALQIEIGGKTYEVSLRFKRRYKPFAVELLEFKFDRYPGTQKPRNYSSDIILTDTDGDGTISLQEFQAAHERIFKAMDANKDGVLSEAERRAAHGARGQRHPSRPSRAEATQPARHRLSLPRRCDESAEL